MLLQICNRNVGHNHRPNRYIINFRAITTHMQNILVTKIRIINNLLKFKNVWAPSIFLLYNEQLNFS